MRKFILGMLVALITAGCGGQGSETTESPEPAPEAAQPEAAPESPAPESPDPDIPSMRNFAAVTIGPYNVQPMYEEEIPNGHYNLRISGGDFAAARIWVGQEDPGDNMVVKTEVEYDYQHGHLDIPQPLPEGYALWMEIEAPDGTLHKGSTPLEAAE